MLKRTHKTVAKQLCRCANEIIGFYLESNQAFKA